MELTKIDVIEKIEDGICKLWIGEFDSPHLNRMISDIMKYYQIKFTGNDFSQIFCAVKRRIEKGLI